MLRLALFATGALARVMDRHSVVPERWTQVRSAEPTESIVLRLALRQQRAEQLESDMVDISTPGHAKYGQHLTRDQLRSYTAPTKRAVSDVSEWLQKHDIEGSVDNDWITIRTTVKRANKLLDTEFSWYQYEQGGQPKLRTLSYSIPDELTKHIDLVQPTTRFGELEPHKSTIFDIQYGDDLQFGSSKTSQLSQAGTEAVSCSPVTPDCLRELYQINYTVKAGATGNLVAFASFLGQHARAADLGAFQQRYLPAALNQGFTDVLLNGANNDQNSTSDAS